VSAFYEIWFPARKELFTLLRSRLEEPNTVSRDIIRDAVGKFTHTLSPYNKRFLEMCLQRYTAYLKGWLNKPN
jgi:hypothetical protein